MPNDNTVCVIGNLTRDPEAGVTGSGVSYARLGIAYNRRKKQGDEWVDADPSFFNITAWNDLADNITASLAKGDRVIVSGRLEYRKWTDDEGVEKNAIQIVADEVAPSLRWATVDITKTEKTGGGTGGARADQAPVEEEPF